jgi:hypothetical protein
VRVRNGLFNALIAILSVVASYAVAEAAFCLVGLRYIPLRLHSDLPLDIRLFAQSSKQGVVPREPIVLLGDSYAQGFGEWLIEADPNRNGPFHSAHVIQELTGRDVITIGQSGAGSAEGLAALPANAYARTADAWYLRLPTPSLAVIYFYEGNDLNDNLSYLRKNVAISGRVDVVTRIDSAIAAYPAALRQPDSNSSFPLLSFLCRIALRSYADLRGVTVPLGAESLDAKRPVRPDGQLNFVEVAGKKVALPSDLQSPALELTETELSNAVLVFERSLLFLRDMFPQAPVLVIYIPSPLSSYKLDVAEISAQSYEDGRPFRFPKERVTTSSDAICNLIRTASIGQNVGFYDFRPALRAIGSQELVHGPRDYKHLNRAGMTALGRAVAEQVGRAANQGACATGP